MLNRFDPENKIMDTYKTRFGFNPKRCIDYLSPFGKNVLDILLKISDQTRSKNKFQRPSQPPRSYYADRVLVFEDSNSIASPVVADPSECQFENIKTINNKKKCNLDCSEELPAVPTSDELVCTLPIREELLNNDTIDKNSDSFLSRISLINNTYNINSDGEDCDFNNQNPPNAIDWNDMFDTDLLKAVSNNQTNDTNLKPKSKAEYFNVLENASKIHEEIAISSRVDNETKLAVAKVLKRKNQTKLTDNINFKKVKKNSTVGNKIPKPSFRKEKYTKSVKNWLNNVTSCDIIPNLNLEDGIISNQNDIIDSNNINDNVKKVESNKENTEIINIGNIAKTKKATKVIQAQLTNKGGVMKYSKPKNEEVDPGKILTENTTNKIEEKENNIKDNKTKSKFVAPIKSQIPVKYVNYDIIVVKMNNYEQVLNKMRDELFSELFITIVYTNGFSQLNCHHTDDTCIPEGILILANEKLYYLKVSGEVWVKEIVNELLGNTIICYDGKSILLNLMSQNYLQTDKSIEIHDVQIGGSLIDPDSPPETFADLQKLLNYVPPYTIATECNFQKSAWYLTIFKECANKLMTLLKENSLWNVFIYIEMRFLPIIAGMENKGVSVDIAKLKSMENVLLTKIKTVEQQCHKVAGKTFQINSTVQVRAILYDELELDSKCNIKIRETISKGAKSTSESMLRSLMSVHPLPKLILEYRHLYKAHATFLTGIAQHVKDGIVKPNWVQTAAATGRIASNNPNLQAIPKVPFSMYPEGNDIESNHQLNFRSVYVSRQGYELLAADFKHIECRVFAYVASDSALLDALKSRDLFRVLAAKWLGKDVSEISSEDRERTKRIVYANLYGAGARKLMDILGVSYDQALSVVASFNRTFPSLKHFGRSVVARCERNSGRLTTVCGRARTLQHITSDDFALKSHAERQAINFIVQGSAADLCKIAMVETEKRLRLSSRRVDCSLVLQLHDELVWEVAAEDLGTAAGIIKEVMENCGRQCGMDISLPVAMAHGSSWGEMVELFPEE